MVLPGQYSTVGRAGTVNSASALLRSPQPQALEEEGRKEEESREEGRRRAPSSGRRIRAQRGQGISSLMASLTPTLSPNPSITRSPSPPSSPCSQEEAGGPHGFYSPGALSCDSSYHSAPCRLLSAGSSCSQVCASKPETGFVNDKSCSCFA